MPDMRAAVPPLLGSLHRAAMGGRWEGGRAEDHARRWPSTWTDPNALDWWGRGET